MEEIRDPEVLEFVISNILRMFRSRNVSSA